MTDRVTMEEFIKRVSGERLAQWQREVLAELEKVQSTGSGAIHIWLDCRGHIQVSRENP